MEQSARRSEPVAGAIRPAGPADLPGLSRIDSTIFAADPYPFFVLRQLFDVHGEHFLVLDCDDELTGYTLLANTPDRRVSWVLGLGVVPHARGLGHGRRLMTEGLDRMVADKVREARLTVEPDNTIALNLYHSLGFTVVQLCAGYFGPGEDRLIMSLPIG
ncbi:ribosomal-protein-alanine N-acetyltransferase [Kitasatospora sp. MAP12-15]|uniref:GNAT family N-acetyltransferase n=1 Tax=unclassified Kitasatospora TaxID=2633591 RepID=UPI0024766359|nr:N-acetyltransferase [Kitasatospora sp. MAP12-44]MDH6112361.1 ribosomal-protein-alanine N-acetyltransferase [Kitasatospora sp. MAP12-44]